MNPLRAARGVAELNLEQLAEKSGINRDTISRIENGRKARVTTLAKLAKALGIPLSALAELDEGADKAKKAKPATLEVFLDELALGGSLENWQITN